MRRRSPHLYAVRERELARRNRLQELIALVDHLDADVVAVGRRHPRQPHPEAHRSLASTAPSRSIGSRLAGIVTPSHEPAVPTTPIWSAEAKLPLSGGGGGRGRTPPPLPPQSGSKLPHSKASALQRLSIWSGMLIPFAGVAPAIDPTAYIHSSAQVIGDVHVGAHSSVWFHAVVRGDVHHIRIGARTIIQGNALMDVRRGRH